MKQAGFGGNKFVRSRIQAVLYWQRKRKKLAALVPPEPEPPLE